LIGRAGGRRRVGRRAVPCGGLRSGRARDGWLDAETPLILRFDRNGIHPLTGDRIHLGWLTKHHRQHVMARRHLGQVHV
jgi:hypothetical protein